MMRSDCLSRYTHSLWQVEDRYRLPTGPVSLPREPITLYQYEVCPFCCKVKAFLDFHNVRTGMRGPLAAAEWCSVIGTAPRLFATRGISDAHFVLLDTQ